VFELDLLCLLVLLVFNKIIKMYKVNNRGIICQLFRYWFVNFISC